MEWTKGKIIVVAFGVAFVVAFVVAQIQAVNNPKPAPTEYDTMYYASKQLCPKSIIANLKDPDSYKEISTDFGRVTGSKKDYALDIVYTATNSFGGRIKSTARCFLNSEKGIYKIAKLN